MNSNFNYNKSSNKKYLFLVIGLIALICISIFVYFKFIHNKNENIDINTQNIAENASNTSNDEIATTTSQFSAEIHMLKTEEGGRHTPFFSGYNPQFYFETTDIKGSILLPSNIEKVYPGDTVNVTIELLSPVTIKIGTEFTINDSARKVGFGTVTSIH